jgi:hypothetical protein
LYGWVLNAANVRATWPPSGLYTVTLQFMPGKYSDPIVNARLLKRAVDTSAGPGQLHSKA